MADIKSLFMNNRLSMGMFAALVVAIALVSAWENHSVHIMGALPYLIFLLCPILHLFMHGKHGKH